MRRTCSCALTIMASALCCGATLAQTQPTMAATPLAFERNTGRFDGAVRFVSRLGPGATLFLTPRGAVVSLSRTRADGVRLTAPLRMTFAGSAGARAVTGRGRLSGVVNYLMGSDPARWHTGAPTYARVMVAGVYPGIDVEYYGRSAASAGGRTGKAELLEFDFVLKPGADPRHMGLAFEGATDVSLRRGDLSLTTPAGDVVLRRPIAYQTIAGKRADVDCRYVLNGKCAAIAVGRYDRRVPLVVDPVLDYSTFLGGTGADEGNGIAVDSTGCAYIAGATHSADFPTTPGAYATAKNSGWDICVTRLNASGTALIYSTFIGGSGSEHGRDVAVDASGCAYVVGETTSTDYPTTAGAFDTTANGGADVVATKLSPSGDSLVYSTYLGGAEDDTCAAVALDSQQHAYVVGDALSAAFPTTAGAFDTTHSGGTDAFVTKLSADGGSLAYSTFVGAFYYESCHDVAVDASGAAYIVGETRSSTFPTTAGAFDTTFADPVYWLSDAFVTKLSPDGSALVYSTFLGGADWEEGRAIAVDASGAVYVTGNTESADFPVTPGAYDTTYSTYWDAFVTKLDPTGSSLTYSTYLGNVDGDWGTGIAVDYTGSAWVTGRTLGTLFPTTADAFDSTHNGNLDVFLARICPDAGVLAYATFMGGSYDDRANGLALDAAGGIYVVGTTDSAGFPTTAGAFDTSQNGNTDVLVARFEAPVDTDVFVPDRSGTISEAVTLRAYLRRMSDLAWLPGRTIAFGVDGTPVGSALTNASGRADLAWQIPDGPAARTVACAFAGDGQYNPSADTGTLTCLTWTTKMAAFNRTGRITDRTELKARLLRSDNAPLFGKSINFYVDGTFIITRNTNVDGYASYPNYDIPDGAGAGVRTILSEWPGNGGFAAVSKTANLTVLKAIPYIWVLSKSVASGGVANLYAYFRRLYDYKKQEGKSVTFRIDGTWIADATTGSGASEPGVARYLYPTTGLGLGVHKVRCEFAGDAWVDAGYGEGNLTIL